MHSMQSLAAATVHDLYKGVLQFEPHYTSYMYLYILWLFTYTYMHIYKTLYVNKYSASYT